MLERDEHECMRTIFLRETQRGFSREAALALAAGEIIAKREAVSTPPNPVRPDPPPPSPADIEFDRVRAAALARQAAERQAQAEADASVAFILEAGGIACRQNPAH